ncbi:MAG: UDP-N-acetylglucosamine pyrophosphorylase [Candidatus Marinimicrobia bacterium]|nr:UDP-N-acetylglucosamine pyrophosphorylase [Candidatus Neomarinimicrobiota bacterium]|tara:strand:+ start:644 stop:1366 length:723 start_codon:yes stop_codon:yes gene_type:complete
MNLSVIILAAGKGTRMNSELPKVLHQINNKPMILNVVQTANDINANPIITVVGYKSELVKQALKDTRTEFALQEQQKGTAHAVEKCTEQLKNFEGNVLILSGDVPFISPNTLSTLIEKHNQSNAKATVLTCALDNPYGYGRIIKKSDNTLKKIVEHKDATELELAEHEINTGIYIFDSKTLFNVLPEISNNNKQEEYYLTDALNILLDKNEVVFIQKTNRINEIIGINTLEQLKEASNVS